MVDAARQRVPLEAAARSTAGTYMLAKGVLGPRVTEGTAQIHRCADEIENRVRLHQRTCERVDG